MRAMAAALLLLTACASPQRATPAADAREPTPPPPPACADDAGWDEPAAPRRIHGNTWAVGTCGIVAVLVTGDAGHVLIDSGTDTGATQVLANLRTLGIDPAQVRVLLGSHAHVDHAGGLARLQRETGAEVRALPAAATQLRNGASGPDDPQHGSLPGFAPVPRVVEIADGARVRVGTLDLTAHATAGHADGGTSWTWTSCEGNDCRRMVYADSLTAVAAPGYRFSTHADRIAALEASFVRVAALPCEILITPHPSASQLWSRLDGHSALVDAGACTRYADAARTRLRTRLDAEAAGTAP